MGRKSTRDGGDDGQGRARAGRPSLGRTRWAIAGMILGVGGSSWVGVGHRGARPADAQAVAADAQEAAGAEEADGTIDGAVRKVGRGIDDATTEVRGRLGRARGALRNGALAGQVQARLRQDKSLDAEGIDVVVEDEGTVVLKGLVPDAASKEIAVDLTRDTRGVVRVEDHLAVPPRTRVIAASADDDPSAARHRRTR